MINSIKAKGAKGSDFEHELGRLTLIHGPNGSGKTAITDAIQLAVHGAVIWVDKTNQAIMSAYGGNEDGKIFVEVEIDRAQCLRKWARGKDGSVSQDRLVDRRKATDAVFAAALRGTAVFDAAGFMALSDQKKIAAIFAAYPPGDDLAGLDLQLADATAKLNAAAQSVRTKEQLLQGLRDQRSAAKDPGLTASQVTAEIEAVQKEIADRKAADAAAEREARERVERERIEADRVTAEKRAREAEEAKAAADRGRLLAQAARRMAEEALRVEREQAEKDAAARAEAARVAAAQIEASITAKAEPEPIKAEAPPSVSGIQAIINTMQSTGCQTCAAMLVAKRELRRAI